MDGAITTWDVVIIGAGVTGAATAAWLAQESPSVRILLLERCSWPRAKVCGCCLNPAGVSALCALGLGDRFYARGTPVDQVAILAQGRSVTLRHRGGLALERCTMDDILVQHACSHGTRFESPVAAHVTGRQHGLWRVQLTHASGSSEIATHQVVVADGLQGSALAAIGEPGFEPVVRKGSRMGLATILKTWDPQPGIVRMHIARNGYVGIVDLAYGKTCLAAAVDTDWTRAVGGPRNAIAAILAQNDVTITDPNLLKLRGTHLLTRRRGRVAHAGLYVAGDAAGYVEPLSGEGMTWALASAQVLAGLVTHAADDRSADALARSASAWTSFNFRSLRRRQRWSSLLRSFARIPRLVTSAELVVSRVPVAARLAEFALQWSARPYPESGRHAIRSCHREALA